MSEGKDITGYIGTVHQVREETTGRTVTIEIGDGGPLRAADGRKLWDGRQVLTLTCSFTDGLRSSWATADGAAGELAARLFKPYSTGMLNTGDGFEMQIERHREKGSGNGGTTYVFRVFAGPLDTSAKYTAMQDAGVPLAVVLKAIKADHGRRAGVTEVEARWAATRKELGLPPGPWES